MAPRMTHHQSRKSKGPRSGKGGDDNSKLGRTKLADLMKRKALAMNRKVKRTVDEVYSSSSKQVKTKRKLVQKKDRKIPPSQRRVEESDSDDSDDNENPFVPLYETTYMEDYLQAVESVDEIGRSNSELMETFAELYGLGNEMEELMGNLSIDELDFEKVTDEQRQILNKLEASLSTGQTLSCHGLLMANQLEQCVEEKLHILKCDLQNLQDCHKKGDAEKPSMPKSRPTIIKPTSINPPGLPTKLSPGCKTDDASSNSEQASYSGYQYLACPSPAVSLSSSFTSLESKSQSCGTPTDDRRVRSCKLKNPPVYVFNGKQMTSNNSTPRKAEQGSQQSKATGENNGNARKTPVKRTPVKKAPQPVTDESDSSSSEDDQESPQPTYCICSKISHGKMIQCDSEICPIEWFHFACVQLKKGPKGNWYCPHCRGESQHVRKPFNQLVKGLAKYNKEQEALN